MTPTGVSAALWGSVLDPARRGEAARVGVDVARRATDPARIAEALALAPGQTQFPQSLRWTPHSVAEGDAGLALLCSYLDAHEPDAGWDRTGHDLLTTAVTGIRKAPRLPPGVFSGLSGVALAAESLSRGGRRYGRLLEGLDTKLAVSVTAMSARLHRIRGSGGVGEFDAISGASGIGAYLLRRDSHNLLPSLLDGLVALTGPADTPPRWATPAQYMVDTSARLYPFGNLNCGLAHGIPGPLALLALALREGREVEGQAAAIERMADWLTAHRVDDRWGVNWPSAVPLPAPDETAAVPQPPRATRAAWCYGSPGIARALWLAGDALGDSAMRDLAVEAMLAVHRRPKQARQIESPTFCHGVAGLLQIELRFARDTGRAEFAEASAALVDQLLEAYEPERPLGYASLEPGDNPVDRAGLLDGAPGVAMVLLAAATDLEPAWDRLFLLS
jgi:hypothetical protein